MHELGLSRNQPGDCRRLGQQQGGHGGWGGVCWLCLWSLLWANGRSCAWQKELLLAKVLLHTHSSGWLQWESLAST